MGENAVVLLALDLLVKIDANLLEYVVCHIVILVVCDDICRSCKPWRGNGRTHVTRGQRAQYLVFGQLLHLQL